MRRYGDNLAQQLLSFCLLVIEEQTPSSGQFAVRLRRLVAHAHEFKTLVSAKESFWGCQAQELITSASPSKNQLQEAGNSFPIAARNLQQVSQSRIRFFMIGVQFQSPAQVTFFLRQPPGNLTAAGHSQC